MSNHPNRSKNPNPAVMRSPKSAQIIKTREDAGQTQTQAAAVVGVTLSAWQRWEQGEREMHAATWDLYLRKLEEMPGLTYNLGRPDHPLRHFDATSGEMIDVGRGWLLGTATDGKHTASIVLSPRGAILVSVQAASLYGSVWYSSPAGAVSWMFENAGTALGREALQQAALRYPPIGEALAEIQK